MVINHVSSEPVVTNRVSRVVAAGSCNTIIHAPPTPYSWREDRAGEEHTFLTCPYLCLQDLIFHSRVSGGFFKSQYPSEQCIPPATCTGITWDLGRTGDSAGLEQDSVGGWS